MVYISTHQQLITASREPTVVVGDLLMRGVGHQLAALSTSAFTATKLCPMQHLVRWPEHVLSVASARSGLKRLPLMCDSSLSAFTAAAKMICCSSRCNCVHLSDPINLCVLAGPPVTARWVASLGQDPWSLCCWCSLCRCCCWTTLAADCLIGWLCGRLER